ncbi:polysaccharide pyruvyl transferase family protein [Clostridium sp. SM-530-WT-3G]|uniref:polysaccharide pyruvyl transferase family protein n=1 Tax=Clostridium sp. SM-530-WT-3G TaxID=2725303 RepID=UPI001FAE721A|nr:polysaccharide pyruvyl transferase family protein [Clostridium sp. SM-530-WT-3G]
MMIKVGILSMQRIANYGSFLQAYGLKNILEDLGCEVQFVDYHPGDTLVPADGGTGVKRKICKVSEVIKCNAPLKEKIRFIKYKKNYAVNYFPYLGINNQMNYSPEVDLLVIGSDEVFNCVQSNTNVGFSPELFGQGSHAKRIVTYAASFGNTTEEKLKQYKVADKVGKWLKKMDAISVRDGNSGEVVKAVSGVMPEYHLDPVLAYDFIGKCNDIPRTITEDKYMLLYGYSGRFTKEECKQIRSYAKSKGLKIFCIGGVQDVCDKFIDCNPFEVIVYFQHAECVVTDTFHGTILSVITHRQFVSVIRNSGYGNSEKMTDLLERLGLKSRIIDSLKELPDVLRIGIDFEDVDTKINKERQRSYEYLERQVSWIINH